ncbi:MAG: peptide chain release factor N(5)-glutamine methyltransferase [Candidatus Binatia bacterium]
MNPTRFPQTIVNTLAEAADALSSSGIASPRLDAEVLLAHTLGLNRSGLYTRLHDPLPESQAARFQELIQRRRHREPLQYITGVQEFWSLEFKVTPDVLIPRPETELIVETALQLLSPVPNPQSPIPSLLDIGTGSGCIAIALAKELPEAEIWATDISSAALAVAQENARRHRVAERLHFLQGDLFASFAEQGRHFTLMVSNPPYIAQSDLPRLQPEVCDWEPVLALDGGPEGLDYYTRLLHECPAYLAPHGYLVMEIGHGQHAPVLALVQQSRELTFCSSRDDYAGLERTVVVQRR